MQLLAGIVFLGVVIAIWALVGHGIWVGFASLFRSASKRECPECKQDLFSDDKACRVCGWTSRRVDTNKALTICVQGLNEAFKRNLIDASALERGLQTVESLRKSLHNNRKTTPTETSPKPTLNSSQAILPPTATAVERLRNVVGDKRTRTELPRSIAAEAGDCGHELKPPVPRTVIPPVLVAAHALDRDIEDEPTSNAIARQSDKPSRNWSKWLSAFLEEKNIQWGELIGGLLIICCSAALVISFWENIASRPWLKFSIFTGINAATLGLGLNAWYRWKLPNTSYGILMIGMMLIPLNFLALAIFTLGMPLDTWTVMGEVLSLGVLGALSWSAAQVLTPRTVIVTTVTAISFALSNLIVRRIVTTETQWAGLFGFASALVVFYVVLMYLGWRERVKKEPEEFLSSLRLLALGTFGCALAIGMLLACSGNSWRTIHQLSSLASIAAFPSLFYALNIQKSLQKGSRWLLPIALVAAVSLSMSILSLMFAFPTPLWMMLSLLGLGGLVAYIAFCINQPWIYYGLYAIASTIAVNIWHVAGGYVEIVEENIPTVVRAFVSASTGFALMACSTAILVGAIAMHQSKMFASGLIALRSAWFVGIAGLLAISIFGLGRHEYAISVAIVYSLYATALISVAAYRTPTYHDIVAGFFIMIASIQAISFGWMNESGFFASGFWSMVVATCAFAIAVSLRGSLVPTATERDKHLIVWMQVAASIASGLCCLWLVTAEFESLRLQLPTQWANISYLEFFVLAIIWGVIAWILVLPAYWTMAQGIAIVSGAFAIYGYSKHQAWFSEVYFGFLHPLSLQMQMAWVAVFASAVILTKALLSRTNATTTHWSIARFTNIHQANLASAALSYVGFGTVLLCAYGAIPGVLQELVPRDSFEQLQSVSFEINGVQQVRDIPAIEQLSILELPHAAMAWSRQGISHGIAGLPSIMCLWLVVLASSSLLLFFQPSRIRWALWLTVLVSVVFPIASMWESEVAVASALRWELGIYFVVGCVGLRQWHLNRTNNQSQFDSLFQLIVMHVATPMLLMAMVVFLGALARSHPSSLDWLIWISVVGAGLLGAIVALPSYVQGSSNSGPRKRSIQATAISTLLVFPLLAWLSLQVVLALMQHPLTGPNANSLFIRIGLAVSYAVPILLVSIGFLVAAASRPSPFLSFIASVVLIVSGMAGYMLALKSNGLRPAAWIGLAALLSAIGGLYALSWCWYARRQSFMRLGSTGEASSLDLERVFWQRCLQQISTGFLTSGIVGGMVLSWINGPALNHVALSSVGMTIAALVTFALRCLTSDRVQREWWILAMGMLVATSVSAVVNDVRISVGLSSLLLLTTSALLVWGAKRIESSSSFQICFGIANSLACLFAFRELAEANGNWLSILALSLSSILTLCMGWISKRSAYVGLSSLIAHIAGLIFCFSQLWALNILGFVSSTFLVQIGISSMICFVSSAIGFGANVRPILRFTILILVLISFGWVAVALIHEIESFNLGLYFAAILICFFASVAGYWVRNCRDVDLLVYSAGTCGVVWLLQILEPKPNQMLWVSSLFFAAYCLGSSFVWRGSDRIRESINRLGLFPKIEVGRTATGVVVANTALAILVTSLGVAAQFLLATQSLRFASAQAIMAVAIAVGFLARYKDSRETSDDADKEATRVDRGTTAMRTTSLFLGVIAAVAFGWHFFDISTVSIVDRLASTSLSLALIGAVYGFGLVKWLGMKDAWQEAALQLMPTLLIAASSCVLLGLCGEYSASTGSNTVEAVSISTTVSILLTIVVSIVLGLAAALLPGRDPIGLSERGRTAYVYAVEFLIVMLVVHLRLTLPWLFAGWIQSVWPILIVALAFLGLGASEWARRRKIGVLAEPLQRTGAFLPMLPVLAHWMIPSNVHYSVSLWSAAIAYGSIGYLRKSMAYCGIGLLAGNAGLWYLLHESRFSFANQPQMWVIPPAICVLVLVQAMRNQMRRGQVAAARYAATSSIYVASTTELFMRGIAEAPWMPIVLAALSIAGILFGIGARIRAMLWLGTMFLCVALFSIIWHAAVDLQQTWVWYVTGIVMGIIILSMFALFEKRREELKKLVTTIQTWDE